ncbi:hypothetical protein FNH22_00215 [Fulvivirga sp. M361]|uniref:hypothetical protein n=1 Tax=Fulvivirga sp. M361 TaxID=2594266 RepID=UPI0011798B5D|nr:hypothetical protein [Fulvivirga sp. M361]TRX62554.1 hypothetical protein FNH22_00215 [Fulvivirga sp. M361]
MEINQAKSGARALFYQSAFLAGFGVSRDSADRIDQLIDMSFSKIDEDRYPEAVASLLKVLRETLIYAQKEGLKVLTETSVDEGQAKACPVYPFDEWPPFSNG